jgi:hypothetical protein
MNFAPSKSPQRGGDGYSFVIHPISVRVYAIRLG